MDLDLQNELKKQMVSKFLKSKTTYEENLGKAYICVWGQCSDFIQSCIKPFLSYKAINNIKDAIEFLKAIKGATFHFEEEQYLELALLETIKKAFLFYQGPTMNKASYFEQFDDMIELIKQFGGSAPMHPSLIKKSPKLQ
eukprot:6280297-Ditylum_brightwellii.AAC.1